MTPSDMTRVAEFLVELEDLSCKHGIRLHSDAYIGIYSGTSEAPRHYGMLLGYLDDDLEDAYGMHA